MRRYWLTVHWPHPADASIDWFVYLQQQYRQMGTQLSSGHPVVFYETAAGKAHYPDGSDKPVRLLQGRQAVIGCAEVSGPLRPSVTGVRQYEDGTALNRLFICFR